MRWMIVSAYAAFLVAGTLIPLNQLSTFTINWRSDLVLHLLGWTVLGFLTTMEWAKIISPFRAAALATLVAVCFGALLEVLQPLTGRSAELSDFAADTLGAVIGATVASSVSMRGQRMRQPRKGLD